MYVGTKRFVFSQDSSFPNLNLVESPLPVAVGRAMVIQPSEVTKMNQTVNMVIKSKFGVNCPQFDC